MEHSCKCCDLIFSLVQLLFAFVSIRIAKFSFSEKAVLATQSSMCLHDNIKQIMFKFHTQEICACSHTLKAGLKLNFRAWSPLGPVSLNS